MKNNKKGILFASVAFAVFLAAFFCPKISKAYEDYTPPTVTSLKISPTEIDTSSSNQTLTLEIGLKDDQSEVCTEFACNYTSYFGDRVTVGIQPLISTQMLTFHDQNWERISGDNHDGVYRATLTVPAGSKSGIWKISWLRTVDVLHNWKDFTEEEISSIPGISGLTIANTAESSSVRIDREWTLSSSKASVTFPENTTVTKRDGGEFAFYQMVNQEASIGDLATDGLTGYTAGTIRFGIPGLNLSFDKPVTVALNVGTQYNDNTLTIKSLGEGENSWTNDTTCKVSRGVCQFSVSHATYFAARSSKNLQGKLSLKVSVKKKVKKSSVRLTGKTGKYLTVTITVNGQLMTTLTASKKGKFAYRVPLQIGANTVIVQTSNGSGTKTITKTISRR
jgi:hypothetical protein